MPAPRSVASMLSRALGDFPLHPQGRPRAGSDTTVTREPASPSAHADPASLMLRCSWRQGMLWSRGGLTVVGGPQAIEGGRWKEPSNPITTTTSTPSGTKRPTSMPTTTSHRSWSPSTLPRSSASSAASPGSRSQASSGQSVESGTPTPQPSRRCGSATSALPGWRRYSPRSPQDHNGSEGGGNGHPALSRTEEARGSNPLTSTNP
jgi:hypothetical protein